MKTLSFIIICTIILSAPQSINASAVESSKVEINNYQYENIIDLMSLDIIEYRYREYKNRLQYRRWNVTKKRWVDPHWTNM